MKTINEFQKEMFDLINDYYAKYYEVDGMDDLQREDHASPVKAKYEEVCNEAKSLFPLAPCYETDPWLWQYFSDYFKDVNGVRPHGEWSIEEVKNWCMQEHELN
jgi:hypothetical protein